MLNRNKLQKLALIRLEEAQILLNNRQFSGSYYLSGYAIECALKACIAKNVKQFDFPDKKIVNQSYSHDLLNLLGVAGLKSRKEADELLNPEFSANWEMVEKWDETSRYKVVLEDSAQELNKAISEKNNGVLVWIQQYW